VRLLKRHRVDFVFQHHRRSKVRVNFQHLINVYVRLTFISQHRLRPRRIRCVGHKKINFSQVFAGQAVVIKEVHVDMWLVSFMDYDLGYFDLETRVLEPLENPFGPKVLPMS
jgi:hypothetical protein